MRSFRILMAVLVLATGAPLIARLGATTIMRATGCTLESAAARPCVVGGMDMSMDMSGVLITLGTVSSALFATLPFLMALVLAWVLTELGHRYTSRSM